MIQLHEPGTIRHIHFHRPKTINGYPVTYWGTHDEQLAEVTMENAKAISRSGHEPMSLYTWAEDCPHENPENDERFEGVNDLVDEWMQRNVAGLTWRDGPLYYKNRKRAEASVALHVEWRQAQDAYDDVHSGIVCLDEPMGSCCPICTEGSEDFGYEPGGCQLAEQIRDRYDEFWWRVSPEGMQDRARQEPTA